MTDLNEPYYPEKTDKNESMTDMLIPINGKPENSKLPFIFYCSIILSSLSAFQMGYNISCLNTSKSDIENSLSIPDDSIWFPLIVSTFCLGALIGSYTGSYFSDLYGRRFYILVNNFYFIVSGFSMALSTEPWMLLVSRIVVGFASGNVTTVVPIYLSEISPIKLRGTMGVSFQLSVTFGVFLPELLGKPLLGDPGWRYLLGIMMIPSFIQIFLFFLMVESPRWYLLNNNEEKAIEMMKKLRGYPEIDSDIQDIKPSKEEDKEQPINVCSQKSTVVPLLLSLSFLVFQQLSGINAIFYYSTFFFKVAYIEDNWLGTVLCGLINMLAVIPVTYLIEKTGRRFLLLLSSISMALCCIALTICLSVKITTTVGWIIIIIILIYVIGFELGLGPIPWLIVSELLPAKYSGSVMAIANGGQWISNFIVGFTFIYIQKYLQTYTFIPFLVCLTINTIIIYFWLPETKQKSVQEITLYFQNKYPKNN